MLRTIINFFLIGFLLAAQPLSAQKILDIRSGSIDFHSDAPLELITASSKDLRGKIDVEKKQFAFVVRISTFTGFNNPLQREHFNENYMESNLFPNASFTGKIIEDVDFSQDGNITVRAKGNLLVHGVPQERIIKCDLSIQKGVVKLKSNFSVMLADHNIAIPKVVHEKLASEIKVEVNAELAAK